MENIIRKRINQIFGMIFQKYRLNNQLTQEKVAEELKNQQKLSLKLKLKKMEQVKKLI